MKLHYLLIWIFLNILILLAIAIYPACSNAEGIKLMTATTSAPVEPQEAPQIELDWFKERPTIKQLVYINFANNPAMIRTIKCESEFRQFDSKGRPLISPTRDVGVMQINHIHWPEAQKLGLDIFYSPEDNIEMGKIIYKRQGINAWVCYTKK